MEEQGINERLPDAGAGLLPTVEPVPVSPPGGAAIPDAVLIEVERNAEGEVLICTGCGTVETIRSIRARIATAFCCCPERKMVRAADLGDYEKPVWRPLSDTAWLDGRDIVLLAHDMEVHARFCPGEWSDDTPNSPAEYSGAVWSCFDDQFQIEIEEISPNPTDWHHGQATHWRYLTTRPAIAIEARQGRDGEAGSVHESAAIAQPIDLSPTYTDEGR